MNCRLKDMAQEVCFLILKEEWNQYSAKLTLKGCVTLDASDRNAMQVIFRMQVIENSNSFVLNIKYI